MTILLEHAKQHLDVAQFNAFVNRRNDGGSTALMDSVGPLRKQFHMDVTTILLDHGADATIPRFFDDITILHLASYEGRPDLAKLLLDYVQPKLTPSRFTAFLNQRNHRGRTALLDSIRGASGNPSPEILQLLLDRGADYTIPNKDGVTPLHAAASHGNVTVLQTLLAHSSEKDPSHFTSFINTCNKWGKTALHDACEKGRPRVTKLLMDYGIDFTLADKEGRTALHWCVPRDQIKTMRVLLEAAKARGEGSSSDKDPFSSAFEPFINCQRSGDITTALDDACTRGNLEMVSLLLTYGAEYDSDDIYRHRGSTPLQHAIAQDHANR
ncbi:MAG: hypothetical protein L6R38_003646 [Xanthoria sp. 2 TBL-2021]|nr:MAG: hypothetical protein L6R38_003646 [Xanthoria sp. 2 TBL-2021]